MILRSLHVEGFGAHRDLKMDGFEAGLNVVYGENEAGKSTLLQFLRAILYGFDDPRRAKKWEPVGGGVFGGSVTLELEAGERIRFTRHFREGRKATGDLSADSGGPVADPEAALKRALGASSRPLFESVFAISLDDLQAIHAAGLRDHIYGAGLTGKGASLPIALNDLRKRSRDLLPTGAKGGKIGKLLDEIADVRRRIDELAKLPETHREHVETIAALTRKIEEMDQVLPMARSEQRQAQRLARAAEPFAALAELPTIAAEAPRFPPAGEARLKESQEAIARARSGVERARTRRDEIRRRLESASYDKALIAEAPEIDTSYAESDRRLGNDAPGLARARATELNAKYEEKLGTLGKQWDLARVEAFDASAESERALIGASERAQASENRAREARRDADIATDSEVRDREEIARLLTEIERIGDAEDRAEKLEKRVREFEKTLDEEKEAEILWKDVDRRRVLAGQIVNSPKLSWLAAHRRQILALTLLVTAVELLLAFALFRTEVPAVGVLVLMVLFGGGYAFGLWDDRRSFARNAGVAPLGAPTGREVEELRLRVDRARQQHKDRSIITFERPDAGEEDAHRLRSEIGDLRAQGKRRTEAERIVSEKKSDLAKAARIALEKRGVAEMATRDFESSRAELKSWLDAHRLPADTAAESARTTLLAVREVKDVARERDEARVELERLEKAAREFAGRAGALIEKMGRPRPEGVEAGAVHASLSALREASLAARKARDEEARDRADLPRATTELDEAGHELAAAEESLAALLAEADAKDLDGFLARAQAAEFWRTARERHDALEARLAATLGDQDVAAARVMLKKTPADELARLAADAERELARIERAREDALISRTRADTERARLENEAGLASLRAEEEARREELRAAAEQWRTLVAAEFLLEEARRKFEEEHQPGILLAAGRFLETMTRGRWIGIRSVEGEKETDRLRAVRFDDPEKLHALETLSRGTVEQLYLALRLALALEFPDPGVKLPLVLDDVLVNFSGSRRALAAEAFARVSQRVQVIAFTCHPEMRDVFLATTKTARRMDLPDPARPEEGAVPRKKPNDKQLRLDV